MAPISAYESKMASDSEGLRPKTFLNLLFCRFYVENGFRFGRVTTGYKIATSPCPYRVENGFRFGRVTTSYRQVQR